MAYPSPLIDLKVDGTSILSHAVILEVIGDLFTTPPLRGSNFVVPGVAGETHVAKPQAAFNFSVGIAVLPGDPATGVEPAAFDDLVGQWVDNWRALVALCSPGLHTVTRILPSKASGTISESCSAEVTGSIAPTMIGAYASRAVLDFRNLSGSWA